MSNIIQLKQKEIQARESIQAEARSWLVRLDADESMQLDREEFHEWLDRSPYHQEAFRLVASCWQDLDYLAKVLDRSTTSTYSHKQAPLSGRFTRLSTLRHAVPGLVLIVGMIMAVSVYQDRWGNSDNGSFTALYTTKIGETRSITLPDTSSVRMNTDSEITIHYKAGNRIIHLSKGEAWFDVYHDPERPFFVYAGRLAVQAVGTAFSVYVNEGKVDLTVTDGRIEVATFMEDVSAQSLLGNEELQTAIYRVPVVAGQNMIMDEPVEVFKDKIELVRDLEPAQIEKRLSWRDGILMFDNDTLEEVVAEINRYSSVKIVISDPAIRELRFGGYFQASDVTTILDALEQNYGIAVERLNPKEIHLSQPADLQ